MGYIAACRANRPQSGYEWSLKFRNLFLFGVSGLCFSLWCGLGLCFTIPSLFRFVFTHEFAVFGFAVELAFFMVNLA